MKALPLGLSCLGTFREGRGRQRVSPRRQEQQQFMPEGLKADDLQEGMMVMDNRRGNLNTMVIALV